MPRVFQSVFRAWRQLAFALVLSAFATIVHAGSLDENVEYRIKAAYLFNFTKFIDWPASAYSSPATPFVIGVLDPEGIAAAVVKETLRGKQTPSGRTIEVRRLTTLGPEANTCHQLFITRAAGLSPSDIQGSISGGTVLLVGETEAFAEQGGVIGFVISGDGVHCDVNLAGAQRAGVKLSGRFASVARLVRENPRVR